ncbi:hypothetical protein [Marinimicrococcus flavescens]|uniref:ATP-grasp domain-containing protein n=1 Tax=Marinimicrococcus flavescens TaxID=3031815 RepID=A0AAP3UYU9_9PROT|nr:hypothetical protein [Marinimicrococcus flavescens]
MRVLLLGAAGSLLGPVVAAALARAGAQVVRGHGTGDPPLHSRHHAGYLAHPPLGDPAALQAFMLAFARENPETVLLPGNDAALLALQPVRHELDRLMPVAAPPPGVTAVALDKTRTMDLAAAVTDGLHPPPTITPENAEDAAARWNGPWPVVVKPRTGTGTEGIRLARDAAELRAAYALVAASYERPLVQMAVQFDIERKFHLFYLFDHTGRLRGWYGQRNLAEQRSMRLGASGRKIPGGVALYWQSWFDEPLLERGRRVMEAAGWRGLGFIEGAFDRRDGRPYMFEINPRIGGTQALSLKQGINFAHDACLVAQSRIPPERLRFATGVRAKRDPFTLLRTRDPRLMLRALDPTCTSSLPRLDDPRPLLQALWRNLPFRRAPAG